MASLENHLKPLPYHDALAEYLSTSESEVWGWFASSKARSDYADELRLEILKQTYRLEPSIYPDLFQSLERARAVLIPDLPVTLYQSQRSSYGMNASIYCLPGEAHIVFEGNVLQLLAPAEMLGVLGHELAHYMLWNEAGGRFLVVDRIAQAMAAEPRAEPSHVESARLLRLYTEIYADRGALLAAGEIAPVVSGLVKLQTGLAQVDAGSYLKQADEVFTRGNTRTEELSHPEAFIRARAIRLWVDEHASADAEVVRMIEGSLSLEKLDLLGQLRLAGHSRRWLRLLLRPSWFQTDAVRAHARLFFPDFEFAGQDHTDDSLLADLRTLPAAVRDYFCYLLLDFATVDPELEDESLKSAYAMAHALDWADRLEALAVRELKLKKKDARALREAAVPPRPEASS